MKIDKTLTSDGYVRNDLDRSIYCKCTENVGVSICLYQNDMQILVLH